MGVGEFSIINDKWKGIAVDYYVDKEYEPYAQEIFGDTPAMLEFFSDYTGIAYPWPKYAQMVGVDYRKRSHGEHYSSAASGGSLSDFR